jgi:hypothetical protein
MEAFFDSIGPKATSRVRARGSVPAGISLRCAADSLIINSSPDLIGGRAALQAINKRSQLR